MSLNNSVRLIGNVGQDPELRSTNDGRRIAQLSLATNDRWRDKASGEQRERTEWHRIVVFNEGLVTNVIEKYVRKGQQIAIEDKLQTRKWTDNNGTDRWTTEIVITAFDGGIQLLGSNSSGSRPPPAEAGDYGGGPGYAAPASAGGTRRSTRDELDDEIPF